MRRFKNILALYDDSAGADDVFTQAVDLASKNAAHLTLVDVLPEWYTTRTELAERRKRLERVKPAIKAHGVDRIGIHVSSGTPFLEIIREINHGNHDLVIASAEGGSRLSSVFFGSTATHLMRKAPCPVWIVKPGQSAAYRRILVCIDPAVDGGKKDEMNHSMLRLATSLASANAANLDIIHAWQVAGNDRDTLRSEVPDHARERILRKHEEVHKQRLYALLDQYNFAGIDHHIHLPRAMPQQAIVEFAERHDVDLLVMGTVCRTGIPGFIIGNAAETVLSAVKCSVLTVKPNGFVSPVLFADIRKVA